MLKHILIIMLLPMMSFADIEKAEELKIKTFYSLFQERLKQARSNHEFCIRIAHPSLLEIDPLVKYTSPGEDYGPDLLEQYTDCYYEYAKKSLSLLCQKEKELKESIQSLEENGEKEEPLELKKKQLEFIVSERLALEQKGSSITANSYINHELARAIHGSRKLKINFHKLSQIGYGLNSCDKILEEGK